MLVSMTRKILFWFHLSIGVAAGVLIFIMSLTGVMLAFERQILHAVDADMRQITAATDRTRRSLGGMRATAAASMGVQPTSVMIRSGATSSVEFVFGRNRSVYMDPYTGAVLGEGSRAARDFFDTVERWHRALGAALGARSGWRAAAAAANLIYVALLITGVYLWCARSWSWTRIRATLLLRRGLRGRARDWNWHNASGAWCALPLLIITGTGVVMSYPWANAALFRLAGSAAPTRPEARPPQQEPPGSNRGTTASFAADLDRAVAVAEGALAKWHSISVRIPAPDETSVVVTGDEGSGGEVEKRTDLVVATDTGKILRTTRFSDNSLGQRLRALVRFSHTGEEGGLAGQVVAAVATAGGMLSVWAGLSLALRRFRSWRRSGRRGVRGLLYLTVSLATPWVYAEDGPGARMSTASPSSASGLGQAELPPTMPPTYADDAIGYLFGENYRTPFVVTAAQPEGADITRNSVEFTHIDSWRYGHNLVDIILNKSDGAEPAAGGGTGALEVYSIFRSGLGINRELGRPAIDLGPLRDIDIQAGANIEAKNSAFAPNERTLYFGPNFELSIGRGFIDIALHARKEWNHNGVLGVAENYGLDFNTEIVWKMPFRITGFPMAFEGYADYNTAKGKDAFGQQTRAEYITRSLLTVDISRVEGLSAGVLGMGFGFQYWYNEYGKDADKVPGAKQFAPMLSVTVHFR